MSGIIPRIVSIDPENPDPNILSEAATLIRRGGLVAYPTDTTYGLAVDPFNEKAVLRLFAVKRRPLSKPILLLVSDLLCLTSLVREILPLAEEVIKRFWPGPLTLVFQSALGLSPLLTAGTGKIGLRLPKAALPIALVRASGFPLTATSANMSNESSPVTAGEVVQMIGDDVDMVLDGGRCDESLPSTLLDIRGNSPRILREGRVSKDSLEGFFRDHGLELEMFL